MNMKLFPKQIVYKIQQLTLYKTDLKYIGNRYFIYFVIIVQRIYIRCLQLQSRQP